MGYRRIEKRLGERRRESLPAVNEQQAAGERIGE
jgi:hypothetical protein